MLLNRFETALMNNPLRAAIQRGFEAKKLLRLGGPVPDGRALEVGCGRGIGTQLILERFRAGTVDAFDLDPAMVALAQKRLAPYAGRTRLWVGDVEAIRAANDTYDAVFDFGIVHHVPAWRRALLEIFRVLRPGGRFYAEEVLRALLQRGVVRRYLDHPRADRFDRAGFEESLSDVGFRIVASESLGQSFGWFVADKPLR